MAGLLLAEKIARAADVEVVAGELEAGAQAFERLQHLQPPLRRIGQLSVSRHGKQRIGTLLGPADAAADLVELGEAEIVGPMHDQRIGVGDVEARFDDGRRQQHVELAVVEGIHDVVEFARRHLPVGDDEADLRHLLAQEFGDLRLVLDPRHHIKRLAAAIFFTQQRLADH